MAGGPTRFLKKVVQARRVTWGVGVASLLESTVVPAPLELLLVPLMQANRGRLWRLAAAALAGCIAGALIGYGAGYFLQETAGRWLAAVSGGEAAVARAGELVREQGFWLVFSVGVTPVPFQVTMVAAGASGYPLSGFLAAAALSRFLRYFGLAGLVRLFGDAAERLYRRHETAAAVAVTAVVVLLWIVFGVWK